MKLQVLPIKVMRLIVCRQSVGGLYWCFVQHDGADNGLSLDVYKCVDMSSDWTRTGTA